MALNIIKNYLTKNRCYQSGTQTAKIGIQIHTIGAGQDEAQAVANYWNQGAIGACVHYIVDAAVDGKVLQTLPEYIRSWADAGYGNEHLITIEICESDAITYNGGASYKVSNAARFQQDILRGYATAVELCAKICRERGWNPTAKLPSGLYLISSHNEGRLAGLSSAHVDPTHVWDRFGLNMDKFRAAVVQTMTGQAVQPATPDTADTRTLLCVQTGAFTEKGNADALCQDVINHGFDAFVKKIGDYYKVQVGAYSQRSNAETMLSKIQAAGYQAFIAQGTGAAAESNVPKAYQQWVGEVTADTLNVRTGPGTAYPKLAAYDRLNKGNRFRVLGEEGDWLRVLIRETVIGYVYGDYIRRL